MVSSRQRKDVPLFIEEFLCPSVWFFKVIKPYKFYNGDSLYSSRPCFHYHCYRVKVKPIPFCTQNFQTVDKRWFYIAWKCHKFLSNMLSGCLFMFSGILLSTFWFFSFTQRFELEKQTRAKERYWTHKSFINLGKCIAPGGKDINCPPGIAIYCIVFSNISVALSMD